MRIPVAKEGMPIILFGLITGVFLWKVLDWQAGLPFFAFGLFSLWFFRDPEREIPFDPNAVVSPADGRVLKVEQVFEGRYLNADMKKLSIFMSVLDVHVNRAPCDGVVNDIIYDSGSFFVASLDKASEKNERNAVVLENSRKEKILLVQIAGLVARRIICRLKQGEEIKKGQRFGMICFGSRVDLFLPVDTQVVVSAGDRVKAGSSIVGYIR